MICDKKDCTACGACLNICPVDAIALSEDATGFYQVEIDEEKCVHCDACKRACPMVNTVSLARIGGGGENVYAVWNTDAKIREKSSSGGAFSVLASYVLDRGGAVYGAAYLEDLSVAHIRIDCRKDLARLHRSKYVQSRIGTTYREIKNDLAEGRRVLFSGTPCQVAGLYGYLGKDDENLLTCELLCHGVPSSGIYRTYVEELGKKHHSKVKEIDFRYKSAGKTENLKVEFENGETYVTKKSTISDAYYFGFLMNLFLRESCYACKFIGKNTRKADFVIGDFWGIDEAVLEKAPDAHPSFVMLNSVKAQQIMEEVKSECYAVERQMEEAVKKNRTLVVCSKKNRFANQFLKEYQKNRTVLKSNAIRLAKLEYWCKVQILRILKR